MVQRAQLPFLLKLIDDDSDKVRRAVLEGLSTFGDLEKELAEVPPSTRDSVLVQVRHFQRTGVVPPASFELFDDQIVLQEALYRPGQLMRHRHYGYRGVVVDVDEECMADERWYESNRSQPPRNQPWYHVLVDDSDHVTYVAQTNMTPDETGEAVEHPMVSYFFEELEDGAYIRNEKPWPPAEE